MARWALIAGFTWQSSELVSMVIKENFSVFFVSALMGLALYLVSDWSVNRVLRATLGWERMTMTDQFFILWVSVFGSELKKKLFKSSGVSTAQESME
jgi:hypothetical protein